MKPIEGLNGEICFFSNRGTSLHCGDIYLSPIFNNQVFKEQRGRE